MNWKVGDLALLIGPTGKVDGMVEIKALIDSRILPDHDCAVMEFGNPSPHPSSDLWSAKFAWLRPLDSDGKTEVRELVAVGGGLRYESSTTGPDRSTQS